MGIKARSSKIAPATGSGDSGLPYGSAAASGGKSSACHGRPRTGRRYCRYSDPWSTAGEASGNFIAKHDDACSDSEASGYTDTGDLLNGSISADPAHYLLLYFAHLSQRRAEEIDFEYMEQLIKAGANVNATSGSHPVLHEVAASWDVAVAEFLLERGAEVDLVDSQGRTALHVAARTNHFSMVECLLLHGANISACTLNEQQTPVHYAARSDSARALQVLVQHRGDYEARDYKGRTPLHLAAELDRTVAAQYLLSLPHPAECRVHDNQGNSALVSIIRTMPKVALLALNQLHRLAPADRKQYFLLSHLEPEPDCKNSIGVKTPFEMTVEEERYEILTHPVMKELAQWKWKTFVRFYFYLYLVLYLLFMLSWSVLIALPSAQEKHLYVFPTDTWRILLELVALGTYFHQIAEEILEFARSRNTHRAYIAMRVQSLQDDLGNMDSSLQEERKYLEQELLKARKSTSHYLSDPWNIIDIVTFVILFILIILHALDTAAHSEQLARSVARLSCPAVILVWVRVLKHLRGFKSLGPLIAIIQQVMGDILRFFIIISIFYIPYIICFWVQFGGSQSAGLEENTDLQQYFRVIIMLFRMTLIDDYPYDTLRRIDELMTSLLVTSFLVVTSIVGLNLFIALLTDTFQRVYDNAQANAEMQKAQIMIELEYKAWHYWRRRYQRIIHSRCNPCSKYYDDDDTDDENDTPAQLRKITHQIHDLISSLQGVGEGVGRWGGMEDGLSERLDRQEDQMQTVSKHLLEIQSLLLSHQGGRQDVASGDVTGVHQLPASPTEKGEEPNNSTAPTKPLPPQVTVTEVGNLAADRPHQTQQLPPLALYGRPRARPIFRLPLPWNQDNPSPSHSLLGHDSRLHAYSDSESTPHPLHSQTHCSLPQSSPVHFGFTRTTSRVLLDIYRTDSQYSVCNHRRIRLKSAQEMAEDQWEDRVARSKANEHFQ